jgi:ABC-type transporter Mla MlaB component
MSDTLSESRGDVERLMGSAQLTLRPLADESGYAAAGEIDASNRTLLAAALADLIARGGDVHLDLKQVRFVDVGAAELLVSTARRLPNGRQLLLHHPPYELEFMFTTLWPGTASMEAETVDYAESDPDEADGP